MANDPREIRRKLRILEHAEASGDVSKTCRYFGIGRASFYLYGRLSLCKSASKRFSGSVANIYPASAGLPERPNGKSARARLYSW